MDNLETNNTVHRNTNIVTLNVRGLNNSKKRKQIFQWLKDNRADIVFLQETFITEKLFPYVNSSWKGECYHTPTDSTHSRGVSILIRDKLQFEYIDKVISNDGRKLLINAKLNGKEICLVNVYAPNAESKRKYFIDNLEKWVKRHSIDINNVIIAGDFNCCLEDHDRMPRTHLNDKSRITMKNIIESLNICDVWSTLNVGQAGYTYTDKRNGTKSRLDYTLVSKRCSFKMNKCKISVCPLVPDHSALISEIKSEIKSRGSGYWKMNSNIINEDEYKKGLESLVKKTLDENRDMCKQLIWDYLKITIREYTISYSIKKSQERVTRKQTIQADLDRTLNSINNNNVNDDTLIAIKTEKEKELNDMYAYESKGAEIRSRAKWTEQGEKPSNYFLNLEKKRQGLNVIEKVNVNGKEITNQKEVLSACKDFYTSLYQTQNININDINRYLDGTNIPTLNENNTRIL